jgi:hypothetical protein
MGVTDSEETVEVAEGGEEALVDGLSDWLETKEEITEEASTEEELAETEEGV